MQAAHNNSWAERLKISSIFIVGSIAGAFLGAFFDIADKAFKFTDRVGLTRSETIELARDTDRSKFSDDLIRNAWRRLFLAELFARRVSDQAPQSEIDEAWKMYIQSLVDWNANLMIYIVGLELHYDMKKSEGFEDSISKDLSNVDGAVRSIRSAYRGSDNSAVPQELVKEVMKATTFARGRLYFFVRCFRKGAPARENCILLTEEEELRLLESSAKPE